MTVVARTIRISITRLYFIWRLSQAKPFVAIVQCCFLSLISFIPKVLRRTVDIFFLNPGGIDPDVCPIRTVRLAVTIITLCLSFGLSISFCLFFGAFSLTVFVFPDFRLPFTALDRRCTMISVR